MKKTLIPIAIIFIIALLAGCTTGSYTSIGSVEVNTLSSMSMSYFKLNGQRSTQIHVDEGEEVDVKVDIVTTEGKLDLTIVDKDEKSAYKGEDIPTSDFVVTLDKAGEYKLTLDAENHKGKYKISWDKAEQKE